MSELSHYIKLRSGLSGCNAKQFECDKYLDCDSCLEDKIKEHDKQIRADAIDDFAKRLKAECREHYIDCEPCFGVIADSILYEEDIDEIAEQLKDQKKWHISK